MIKGQALVAHRAIMKLLVVFLLSTLFGSAFGASSETTPVADGSRIIVLIKEKVMGVFGTTGHEVPHAAELILIRKFSDVGFDVVDSKTVRRNLIQTKGLRLLEGNDKAAAAAGLQHEARYSVIGTAISKQAGAKLLGTQMQSIQATVTARIVRNDDAQVIATASATGTRAHIDEVQGGVLAIEDAAKEVADELKQALMSVQLREAKAGTSITLNISGLLSYRHLDFVMKFLEQDVEGISAVDMRSFSEGLADLSLIYQGKVQKLARFISRKKFKGFRLEPTNVTANRMDLAIVLSKKK